MKDNSDDVTVPGMSTYINKCAICKLNPPSSISKTQRKLLTYNESSVISNYARVSLHTPPPIYVIFADDTPEQVNRQLLSISALTDDASSTK